MILLRPFSYSHPSLFEAWWDYFGDIALSIPVGAAAVLLWTGDRSRRRPSAAFALGISAIVLVEFGQVFVNSRFADATDVITGSIGVLLGVAAVTALQSSRDDESARRVWWGLSGSPDSLPQDGSWH